MKILYVEDELNSNIPRILLLFGNLLGRKIRRDLESMENDDYPPTPQQIKEVVERSGLIDVEFTFAGALEKVVKHREQYKLFIVDRNLSKEQICELAEIQNLVPSFSEDLHEEYFDREGDYLLQYLVHQKVDCLTFFYFLTAYPISDVLRGSKEIGQLINFEQFSKENFIEKGNEVHYQQLIEKIQSIDEFKIRHDNTPFFLAIEHLGQVDVEEWLLGVFRNAETNSLKGMQENLSTIRNIEERTFRFLRTRLNMPESFTNQWKRTVETYSRGETQRVGVVTYLSENGFFNDEDAKSANALYALCSAYGSHPNSNQSFTKEAHRAAIPLLRLLLLRLGEIMAELQKK